MSPNPLAEIIIVVEGRLCRLTLCTREVGEGGSPGRRVGNAPRVRDVGRDFVAWEVPNADSGLSKLKRIYLWGELSEFNKYHLG